MRKFLIGLFLVLAVASASYAKYESGSLDAQSNVLYGYSGNLIVPIKVASDGTIYTSGGQASINLSALDQGIYFTTNNVYPIGTSTVAPSNIFANAFVGITTDGIVYYATSAVKFSKLGTNTTSVEAITAGSETVSAGNAILAVDGKIYTTSGNIGIRASTPNAYLDVGGGTVTWVDGTNDILAKGDLEVDGSVYAGTGTTTNTAANTGFGYFAGGLETDKSLYLGYQNNYVKQPDGGCSKCGVDAAGTTWSCVDTTCPTGM